MRSNCPEFEAHQPPRTRTGLVQRERAWVGYVLWGVALAAWVEAIRSCPVDVLEFFR